MSEDFLSKDIAVIDREKEKEKVKPPPLYAVVMWNDDFTPMDFVVEILIGTFGHNMEKSTLIMLDVHEKGRGVAGIYTHEIAETKMAMAMRKAMDAEHPFRLSLEQA